jgi:ubiquinone/menaquinone biosynthesis C-methylase UbiE
MSQISADPVYDLALAYQKTAALMAAIRLDLFTLLGSGVRNIETLATATGASRRGVRILCDFLTVLGLLVKHDESYGLTPASQRLLDRSSPLAENDTIDFLAAPEMISLLLDDPVSYVRNGGSPGLANVAPENPVWVRFARAMVPLASVTAKRVAAHVARQPNRPRTVLDIAAGHGLYGIEIAKAVPGVLVTAVDWAGVLAVARAHVESAGLEDRYHMIAGNAFDVAWGSDFDLVLLPNILHHFSHGDCVTLLAKAKSALSDSGRVLAIDFVPNPDRISPPEPAAFAYWMLATTPHGDAHTLEDYDSMAKEAGFSGVAGRLLVPTPETLVLFEA